MDAAVAIAPSDDTRWKYIADALKETAERNEHTAVILERLTVQLDGHDRRIEALEEQQQKATERALDQATVQQQEAPPPQEGISALLNRVYTDWRIVAGVAALLGALVGNHFGITWHW